MDIYDNSSYSFLGRKLAFTFGQDFAILLTPEQISQQVLTDGFGHKKE